MTRKTKLIISALGFVLVAVGPAIAKTLQHFHASHGNIIHVIPPMAGWQGGYGFEPGYMSRNGGEGAPLYTPYGNIRDRQTHGLGY